MTNKNKELLELLKTRLPNFEDEKKLNNMITKAEKLHQINGKIIKKSYPSLNRALIDVPLMLKDKYKLIPERCRSSQGATTFFYELPPALAKKSLENALTAAKNHYIEGIEALQADWLDTQLEEVLQAQKLEEQQAKAEEDQAFKAKLLEAIKKG
tara:strand:+ start:707 stop:1171 length:465 start_codon:yes stop_codon:yes gene_type:complete